MTTALTHPTTRNRLPRNPVARLINLLLRLDHAHRQRTKLADMPNCRLHDMGLQRRDVAKTWNPPPMFLH